MRKTAYLLLAVAGLFSSCHPEPEAIKLIDELVVATNYDPAADFSSYATFSLPTDTIGFISNTSQDTIITQAEVNFPRPVLNLIRSNINALGYTEVDKTQNPDLGINVLVVDNLDIFQTVIYPNYYTGGGYYSGYYGYNSWYYYPYVNTQVYNTGILIIEIVDLKNRTPDNKVKVVWDAYMGDLYNTISFMEQVEKAIDQSFVQSPYLGK